MPILIWFLITIYRKTYKTSHDSDTWSLEVSTSRLSCFFIKCTRWWATHFETVLIDQVVSVAVFKQEAQNQAPGRRAHNSLHCNNPGSLFSPWKPAKGNLYLETLSQHRAIDPLRSAGARRPPASDVAFSAFTLMLGLACSQLEAAVSFSRNFSRTQERKRRNLTPAERSVLPTSGISTLTRRWRRCWWVPCGEDNCDGSSWAPRPWEKRKSCIPYVSRGNIWAIVSNLHTFT